MSINLSIACFISPHGFGHAARTAAVMEAINDLDPSIRFEIFTMVPRWFFEESLSGDFGYHALVTDIGLVQTTPLQADIPKTVQRLNHFLPFDASKINELGVLLKKLEAGVIICDIAPMGIAVAQEAGIPSLLIENFTWDWIYEEYLKQDGQIGDHIHYLKGIFDAAQYHIQTEPICNRRKVDLTTFPVCRKTKMPSLKIRKHLGIPPDVKAVLITMGGIEEQYNFLEQLATRKDVHFIIPGACKQVKKHENLILLPHHSDYFHPDLVNASNAVIGKVGYSTLAEIYYAGVPFGYVARSRFRESQKLTSFIMNQMNGLPISEDHFHTCDWLSSLSDLLALPRTHRKHPQGAEQVARFVYDLIKPP